MFASIDIGFMTLVGLAIGMCPPRAARRTRMFAVDRRRVWPTKVVDQDAARASARAPRAASECSLSIDIQVP